jgi:hypothetical protein
MLRHLFILARENSSLSDRLTITLDRHLARGEQIEIVQDRRSPPAEPRAPQWPAGRERRRASRLADQLRTQGYAIFSRQEEAPEPTARPFEPVLAARDERARAPRDERRALRDRLSDDWDEDLEDRTTSSAPRRRGRLVAVLIVVGALTVGIFFLSTQPRDRLAGAPTPAPPPADTAREAGRSTEESARGASGAPDLTAPTPSPATPAPATPSPGATPSPDATRQASAAPEKATPVESVAPDSPAPSLPPRRAEAPALEPPQDPAPPSIRSQKLPDFPGLPRVEVSRASSADGTTFTVRLTDPRGRPLPDAQVWLRQKSIDGFIRETRLDPVPPAGSYRAAVPVAAGRPEALAIRVILGDRRVEMPVAD